jgi:hypothetical protein
MLTQFVRLLLRGYTSIVDKTLPWYQKPIPWLRSLTENSLEGASTKADGVDSSSLDSVIRTQYAGASLRDRFVRWLTFEPTHLLSSDTSVYSGLRWEDLSFVVMTFVIRMYSRMLAWVPTTTEYPRRDQLEAWSPEDKSLPAFSCTVRLLEYCMNNADILDVLHEGETFEVRTEFLDAYTKKKGVGLLGATIRLEPVLIDAPLYPDERPGDWRIVDVRQGKQIYKRDHISQEMGHAILTGLVAYLTVATHAFHIHYQSGHHRAILSETILPRRHPLRRLLLPTEIGTTNGIGRAVVSLLAENRAFQSIFPFEYTGLEQMLSTYLPWDPSDASDHRTALVMNGSSLHPVLGDYQRWWAYIERTLTPVGQSLAHDGAVLNWRTEMNEGVRSATLENLMTLAFFTQVRHNFLSNTVFSHMGRYMYILQPGTFDLTSAFRFTLILLATKLRWIPLTRGFAEPGCHPSIEKFYAGLEALGSSMRHPLSMPAAIEVSTGM